jgi:hypothetical protein
LDGFLAGLLITWPTFYPSLGNSVIQPASNANLHSNGLITLFLPGANHAAKGVPFEHTSFKSL